MNTFWVTFYSYKGGVGRTMALTNVAASLARKGRRVLLIDFDLEAPGIDAFERLGCTKGNAGVVEYVAEYLSTGKAPSISSYIIECQPKSPYLRGKLWLMPSGKKDHEYNTNRARINWTELYDRFDGERFIENWKADIEQTYRPDYVFIDSRTGLTDVAGICTLHFPQLVVLLYALNDQNIHGIAGVARAISKAPNTRPPQFLTVASPVPPMESEASEALQERFALAEKELGVRPHCEIHYDSRVTLKEQIITWDNPDSWLGREYAALREKIADYDVRGLDFLIKEVKKAVEDIDERRALEVASDLRREYPDRPEYHFQLAQIARAFGRVNEIETHLKAAVDLDPFYSLPCDELVSLLRTQKRYKEAISVLQKRLYAILEKGVYDIATSVQIDLAEICMAAQEYPAAVEAYECLPRKTTVDKPDDVQLLAYGFNYMEARRRAGLPVPESELREIVELYERGAATEAAGPIVLRLNKMQAMHIPYALLGDVTRAKQLLVQASELARSVSPRERIFSVAVYSEIPIDQFLDFNNQMLIALDEGRVWSRTETPRTTEPSLTSEALQLLHEIDNHPKLEERGITIVDAGVLGPGLGHYFPYQWNSLIHRGGSVNIQFLAPLKKIASELAATHYLEKVVEDGRFTIYARSDRERHAV